MTAPAGAAAGRVPRGLLLLVCALTAFASLYARITRLPSAPHFVTPPSREAGAAQDPARYEVRKVSSGSTPFAHSVAAIELLDGALRAFWFGGSREGATDAAIYTSLYSPLARSWGGETVVVSPERLQADLLRWVRKVGNPVVVRDAEGRLHLFVVSVTFGGWAASSINMLTSVDEGASWYPARRLVTSPFLNLSTLVKGAPFVYGDGHLAVPAYHELAGKFGELLHVAASGRVTGKTRMSWGNTSLQPVVVPRGADEAVAFMRYAGPPPGRVLVVRSSDGGRSWSTPVKTALPNPNSAVDALRLPDGSLLLAFNNTEGDRNDLSLAHSRDEGRTWRVVRRIEWSPRPESGPAPEYSYPRLLRTRDGDIHLLYTANKAEIRHVRFNLAWLEEALK